MVTYRLNVKRNYKGPETYNKTKKVQEKKLRQMINSAVGMLIVQCFSPKCGSTQRKGTGIFTAKIRWNRVTSCTTCIFWVGLHLSHTRGDQMNGLSKLLYHLLYNLKGSHACGDEFKVLATKTIKIRKQPISFLKMRKLGLNS